MAHHPVGGGEGGGRGRGEEEGEGASVSPVVRFLRGEIMVFSVSELFLLPLFSDTLVHIRCIDPSCARVTSF